MRKKHNFTNVLFDLLIRIQLQAPDICMIIESLPDLIGFIQQLLQ